ncbi:MAG TPA: transglycosylase family protein [Solirubrobacteraceae bacterium]
MRPTRSLALAGAAGVLATPAAIALAAEPDTAVGTHPRHAGLADTPTLRAQMRGAEHARLLHRLRRLSKAAGEHHPDARIWSNGHLRREIRRLRAELRARSVTSAGTPAPATAPATAGGGSAATPQLAAIAACESGGNPHAVGGGGAFRGKYQFTYQSWQAVGGSGDPAAAPEAEQDRRAAMLMSRSGAGNWPVCGS